MSGSPADATAPGREGYPHLLAIPTRWDDNDVYGHVNNVEYYAFFDTVINRWLIARGRPRHPRRRGDRPLRRVALHLPGRRSRSRRTSRPDCASASSATRASATRSACSAPGREEPAATGWFVHVFVDRETRAAPMPTVPRRRSSACSAGAAGDEDPRRRPARDGAPAPLRRVAAAGDRRARARPARARASCCVRVRAAGPLPLRPVGDRRLAPARDADGARPRGRRRGRRGRGAGVGGFAPGDHVVLAFVPACGDCEPVPAPAAPRSASRARRRTPPARCSAASAGSARRRRAAHHHLGVSAFADHIVVSAPSAVQASTRSCPSRSPPCSAARS